MQAPQRDRASAAGLRPFCSPGRNTVFVMIKQKLEDNVSMTRLDCEKGDKSCFLLIIFWIPVKYIGTCCGFLYFFYILESQHNVLKYSTVTDLL
jgi:hypothetical protein